MATIRRLIAARRSVARLIWETAVETRRMQQEMARRYPGNHFE